MRVLIINTSERIGGAAVAAGRLMESLKNNGIKAKMLVRDKQTDQISVVGLKRSWLHVWKFMWERIVIWKANRFKKNDLFAVDIANTGTDITSLPEFQQADVIHLHWINQGMLSLNTIRKILTSGKPVVWTMHDMWPCTGICHYARECKNYEQECHHCPYIYGGGGKKDLSTRIFRKKKEIYSQASITFVGCSRWLAEKAKVSGLLTGQTVISGMGELHLEIIIDRLKREFKVECNQGRPQVTYKEAITKPVELREVFKKQTGGRGKFADIIVRVEPSTREEGGLEFVDEVKGGNIPKEFIPSIQKGFTTAMKNGVLAGYPVDSLKVTVIDGSFHPVDSDQLSFELCAIQAFKKACEKAGPVLLEPIMKIEVVTPEESMGDVISDLNKRRGQIEGMESSRSGARIVKATAPLAEMFGYVTALRTITSGRATSTMSFSHYSEVSSSIAKNVLTEVNGRVDLL